MSEKQNYPGYRITELWIFVGIDEDDDEGVMAFASPAGPIPMVAADQARVDSLKPIADQMIEIKGGSYEIRHFVRDLDGE